MSKEFYHAIFLVIMLILMQKSLNINTFYDPRADKLRYLLYFLINQHQIKRVNLVKRLF